MLKFDEMNDLKIVLKSIQDRFIEIHYYISEYKILFIEDQEMESVIVEINSRFFNDLYWLYWNFITIRICALMDKKETMGIENLSIPKLISIAELENLKCANELNLKKENILKKIKPFRDARNKAFGHYDLKSNIEKTVFERLELDDLKIICDEIESLLNLIDIELGNTPKLYGARVSHGVMKLNHILKLGVEKKNEYKKLIKK